MKVSKYFLMVVVFVLLTCCKKDTIVGTWSSANTDTIFSVWDISENYIISNKYSPDSAKAKYRLVHNRFVIDSGALVYNDFYISEDSFEYKISQDKFLIFLKYTDFGKTLLLVRNDSLKLCDRFLSEKMLSISLPIINDTFLKNEQSYFINIFAGIPKNYLANRYGNKNYLQLNDAIVNTGDIILREYLFPNGNTPITLYCDKNMTMLEIDSIRGNLSNSKYYYAIISSKNELGYIPSFPFYLCSCVAYYNHPLPPPPPLLSINCRHKNYLLNKCNNIISIDSVGDYFHEGKKISKDELYTYFLGTIYLSDSINYYFIEYSDETKYSSYIYLYYNLLKASKNTVLNTDKRLIIMDINSRDKIYITKKN